MSNAEWNEKGHITSVTVPVNYYKILSIRLIASGLRMRFFLFLWNSEIYCENILYPRYYSFMYSQSLLKQEWKIWYYSRIFVSGVLQGNVTTYKNSRW